MIHHPIMITKHFCYIRLQEQESEMSRIEQMNIYPDRKRELQSTVSAQSHYFRDMIAKMNKEKTEYFIITAAI